MEELRDELLTTVNGTNLDPSRTIGADTDLLLTGLVNSLGVAEIVAWLEDRLDVEIDPLDVVLDNFQSVERMLAFAARLRPDLVMTSSGD